MMDNVFLFSGGVDSAYMVHCLRPPGESCMALFIDYSQPAAKKEFTAARVLTNGLMPFERVKVEGMPLGDMSKGIGPAIVPARNAWLISLGAAWGRTVWLGCTPSDRRDYDDCRLEFLNLTDAMLRTLGKRLCWSGVNRYERIKALEEIEMLDYCWSCYGPGPEPCGECASCTQT